MNIFRTIKSTDFITLLNATIGLVIIFLSIKRIFTVAAILFVIAAILDALDGYLSRKLRKANEFGKQIDSFADLISFGIAPVFFIYYIFVYNLIDINIFLLVTMAIFIVFGLLRLARFNITIVPYFEGMPITVNGLVFPIAYFINFPYFLYPWVFLLSSVLMVSTFKIKKIFRK